MTYPKFNQVKGDFDSSDNSLLEQLNNLRNETDKEFENFNFYLGIQMIMSTLRSTNNLVQDYKPWNLIKSTSDLDKTKLVKLLYLVYESLRICGILLQPIVPNLAEDLLNRLNIKPNERSYNFAQVNASQPDHLISNSSVLFTRLK